MKLHYKFFSIPVNTSTDIEQEMNEFIKNHKIASIKKEFVNNQENTCWFFLIEYFEEIHDKDKKSGKNIKNAIDYREVLSPEIFTRYAKIREWRKQEAAKTAVQLYTILTNEQMAQIAEKKIITIDELKKVSGIGDQRSMIGLSCEKPGFYSWCLIICRN